MQPIHVGRFKVGLEKDVDSYLLPETAFPEMTNAYVFRDKVLRREGVSLLGRLRRNLSSQSLGVTTSTSSFSRNVKSYISLESSGQFVSGSLEVQVGIYLFTSTEGSQQLTCAALPTASGTFNWQTGALSISLGTGSRPVGTAVTATFSYYPGLPVMSLPQREVSNIRIEQTLGFDTTYAYRFNTGSQQFEELAPGTIWRGTDADYFYLTEYYVKNATKLIWATNFNAGANADPIRYYDGSAWEDFVPAVDSTNNLVQARILLPFKNRLLAFNTWEGPATWDGTNFVGSFENYFNRVRWSQNGDPTDEVNGWLSNVQGRGGYIDCPTSEAIVYAEIINDMVIVGFERSTYRLRYTGNEDLPFIWELIDNDLGADSTFSSVNLGSEIYAVCDRAVASCNGVQMDRIDLKIPDDVFNFSYTDNGPERVHAARDFTKEIIYWTFPNDDENVKFPNRVLVLNYRAGAYSYFDDSYTCFGYYQKTSDITWGGTSTTWGETTRTWGGARSQAGFPSIIAGNQQGFVFVLNEKVNNDPSLMIESIQTLAGVTTFTSTESNLREGDVVVLSGLIAPLDVYNGTVAQVQRIDNNIFRLFTFEEDDGTSGFTEPLLINSPVYWGDGLITRVSNFDVKTKKFNPWYEQSIACRLVLTDLYLSVTASGQFTLDLYTDSVLDEPSNVPDALNPLSNVVLTSIEPGQRPSQSQSVHRYSRGARGQFVQLGFRLSDAQMADLSIANQAWTLHFLTMMFAQDGRFV